MGFLYIFNKEWQYYYYYYQIFLCIYMISSDMLVIYAISFVFTWRISIFLKYFLHFNKELQVLWVLFFKEKLGEKGYFTALLLFLLWSILLLACYFLNYSVLTPILHILINSYKLNCIYSP